MMEAYKLKSLDSLLKRLEIFSQFPGQIIVLKNTGMCIQTESNKNMQNSLVRLQITVNFRIFIGQLNAAKMGNKKIYNEIMNRGELADARITNLTDIAVNIVEFFIELADFLEKKDVIFIRRGGDLPQDFFDRILSVSSIIRESILIGAENEDNYTQKTRVKNDFAFRIAISITSWFIEWVRRGSQTKIKIGKTT